MNISSEWVLYALRGHPVAYADMCDSVSRMTPCTELRIGDSVRCINASDSDLVPTQNYVIETITPAHFGLRGVRGQWDTSRFRPVVEGVDPVTILLQAIDRGSWSEVLSARKAFRDPR